jgi:putative ubiquitin-RnfH superfamily antitoxin RatB of RatAB toxin-antitoxin module
VNDSGTLQIEVVYALPKRQWLVSVQLPVGATVADAITASALEQKVEGLRVDPAAVGIHGRKAGMDQVLQDGDRVEIYRPLLADPKEVRRARAAQQRA